MKPRPLALAIIALALSSCGVNNPFRSTTVTDTTSTTAAGVKIQTIVTATSSDPTAIAAALSVMNGLIPLVEDFTKKQPATSIPIAPPLAP